MLINLHVKNLALIKEVDVDFTTGLVVLTGETGAGKSLILGSINIALGNKASKELIRTGSEYSLVELTFKVNDKCKNKLQNMDIYFEENNIVTVTRKITEGRSVSKINGETVNLNTLKNVMSLLIDIHGQHEHQSLLYNSNHLNILDKFAHNKTKDLLDNLSENYKKYKEMLAQLNELNMDEQTRTREIEFAEYEINEISSANLSIGEDELLESKFKETNNSETIVKGLSNIYSLLSYDSEIGAGNNISRAIMEFNSIPSSNEKIENLKNTLNDLDSIARDLTSEILSVTDEFEFDPSLNKEIEERLDTINHLKLKYGQSIEDILVYCEKKQNYLDELNNYNEKITQLNNNIKKVENNLQSVADELSLIRKEYAQKLEKNIIEALKELNFLSVDFKIDFKKNNKITEKGFDNVEFLISTNPGEPLKSLSKVASGGELSRIMLAIKSILASNDEIETMIFDEIDTGISGKTAVMVAEKLAKISKNHQVICISHLAQIAAMADEHFLIEKQAQDNSTTTNIMKLNREESIKELVRISGGEEITSAAISHATEMKDMADRTKCNLV